MKAIEVYAKLNQVKSQAEVLTVSNCKSRVDETKTLHQMLEAWMNLFETFPDMRVGSIILYNVDKDFNIL